MSFPGLCFAPSGLRSLPLAPDLASACRRSEHVGVEAVVVAELKLRNVQRHIFGTHLTERADIKVGCRPAYSTSSIHQRNPTSSPPGLTRWSMLTCGGRGRAERLSERVLSMDCRIKSGKDERKGPAPAPSWPDLFRPSRLIWQGRAELGEIAGTSPAMTAKGCAPVPSWPDTRDRRSAGPSASLFRPSTTSARRAD